MKNSAPGNQPKRVRLTAVQREQQLLNISEQLFTQLGYEGVSIEDIARAAGVTRPIVYQHYGSREGVFLSCVARARRQFEETVLECVAAAGDDISDQIRAGGAAYFDLIEDNPQRFVLLFSNSSSLHSALSDELNALRTKTIHAIAAAFRSQNPQMKAEEALAFAYTASGAGEQLGRWWLAKPSMSKRRLLNYYTAALKGAVDGILTMSPSSARPRHK
ncbi:TetR/AcrR family transcriptional regulator [Mycobacteroides salmoniphilum]|uniref:TetR/AcrR family transcriptional regulator n=1 Tax=Mycobacteroides salmoniphilum TaxID=404941 RepID=UPI0012FF7A4C|nr:TetR/AcrR family transcriptional regulator [Mycobacteroides salmoniphilum]